jgi:PAS domain S-box-containing protein
MQQALAGRVAEYAPAMLVYLDAELRVRFASRHCYELLGRAPREILGRLLAELVDPRTLKYALSHVAELDRGNHMPRDYVLRDSEGARRFLKVHAVPDRDEHGRSVGYFASTQDRAAELAAQERLRFALAGAQAGMWEWDLTKNEVYYSPEFKALLGYSEAGFAPDFTFFAEVHPHDDEATFDAVAQAAQEGRPFDREFRMRCADGGYRWLRGVGRAVLDADSGAVVRFVGTARDISARKQAELELRDARALVDATLDSCMEVTEELAGRRKLDRVKRELVATANHELRTPLAAIIAALELMREGAGESSGHSKESFLTLALQNAEHLARVVEQWLDLERIDLGMLGVRRTPLGLPALVAGVVRDKAALAVERGVGVEVNEAADVQVSGDPERLRQAVAHLVANAIDRSPRGAAVRIHVGMRSDKAVLLIEDEGLDVFSNTYAGLSACKAIIERQGGNLQVANRAARGAAFHVELPCK